MKNNSQLLIVIPAIKKNGVIPDQLIKKLNGKTLIQRAIDTAKNLKVDNIIVVTDSQEISLIAERNDVQYIYNPEFKINNQYILDNFKEFLKPILKDYKHILIYRANTPLVGSDILQKAYNNFSHEKTLVSVKVENRFEYINNTRQERKVYSEINSFIIISSENLQKRNYQFELFEIEPEKAIEINGYQDWWVCEKLLKRKRIVINVLGSVSLGMGHIYRSLALAHEITEQEIIFVCDEKYQLAVTQIASKDYKVISTKDVEKTILKLKPDLVINDVLSTETEFIQNLKKVAKVVNFEDLGEGGKYTDLTINELYEYPVLEGENYRWGSKYYFLRDEFNDAKPHQFVETVTTVLISFGGTDQNNLTLKTFRAILPIAKQFNLEINIVCGGGYLFKDELNKAISEAGYNKIYVTFQSGVISKIMEKSQVAISSNGRTVYELADMNIPTIVISQHKRETTHSFATLERGFINLGIVRENIGKDISTNFYKLVTDAAFRELLFLNIKRYSFRENKRKVVEMILGLLN